MVCRVCHWKWDSIEAQRVGSDVKLPGFKPQLYSELLVSLEQVNKPCKAAVSKALKRADTNKFMYFIELFK